MPGALSAASWSSHLHLLRRLDALQAGAAESNSLFEYATAQALHAASLVPGTGCREEFLDLISRPYSLNDLSVVARKTGIDRHFQLSGGRGGPVGRFLATVGKKRETGSLIGLEGGAHALGLEFAAETFRLALEDPLLEGGLRLALARAEETPLPFLVLNRLFHVLLCADFHFKVTEAIHFPWARRAVDWPQTVPVKNGIRTGFVESQVLNEVMAGIDTAASLTGDVFRSRWRDWDRRSEGLLAVAGAGRWEEFLAGLLRIHPTAASSEFAARLDDGSLAVLIKSRREMRDLDKNNRQPGALRAGAVDAEYHLPEENGGTGAVVLPEETAGIERLRRPGPRLVLASHALQEFVQLRRTVLQGAAWADRHLIEAEMEGYAEEILFRLMSGDVGLYREISQYSPFGFGLALRNFIEHLYIRQGDPLPFPPP